MKVGQEVKGDAERRAPEVDKGEPGERQEQERGEGEGRDKAEGTALEGRGGGLKKRGGLNVGEAGGNGQGVWRGTGVFKGEQGWVLVGESERGS